MSSGDRIRVLHVDDDTAFLELSAAFLEREDGIGVVTETSVKAALDRIERERFDCVVSDYDMPGTNGLEFLSAVREDRPDLPFLLFTGKGSEEIASDAISAGVTDYLQKTGSEDQYEVLANRITNAVDRHRAERALRESEAKYRTLVEQSHDAIFIHRDEDFLFVNDRLCELTGYSESELLECDVYELLHPDHREEARARARDRLDGTDSPQSYEARVLTSGGHVRYCQFRVRRITYDGEPATLGSIRDITGRQRREKDLEQYETIVETMPDGLVVLDEEGTIVRGNEQGASMVGYDIDDLVGEPFAKLVVDGVIGEEALTRYLEAVPELLSSESDLETARYEVPGYGPNGEPRTFENHIALRPYDDEFRGAIGIIRDITEHKRRQRQLERQNERLAEFASVVSHDLRNPLNVVSGRAELALETGDREHVEAIASAAERMETLVDHVLTLAREGQTVGETEPCSIERVARRAWDTVDTAAATLHVERDDEVDADEDRLTAAFENFFRNAVEHAGSDASIRVGAAERGFYVADDGPGIPESEREQVFEFGHSTREDGTGIGLAIVESIVEAHGWEVTVDESESGGARFVVDCSGGQSKP